MMRNFTVLCFILLTNILVLVQSAIVLTNSGRIRGSVEKSRNGNDFHSFRGIRYSAAPLGQYRFQPPRMPRRWTGIYNANKDGPICYQAITKTATEDRMSEDCLVLNVYTKNLNGSAPVIFFIHGGSLVFGTGSSDSFGPQYFMDHDNVVLVTINYRLGIFGYITTGDREAPGNLGFKDQVMALKWVNQNIDKFGGDRDRITIVGHSAGGISVTLHMVSPMSKGLFHRVISMSGSLTTRIPAMNQIQTEIIGGEVGCSMNAGNNDSNVKRSQEFMECLRKTTAKELVDASEKLNEFGKNPIRKWNFVVENDFGQERFLEDDPNALMREGKFTRVPLMIGVTSAEFATYAYDLIMNKTLTKQLDTDFKKYAPICFLYERNIEKSREISNTLRHEYFDVEEISDQNFDQLAQLFSDGILRSGLKRFVDRARKYIDVYLYTNSFAGRYSELYYPEKEPYGVVHGDDLLYIFFRKTVTPMFQENDPENKMVNKMTRLWSNFADRGIPTDSLDKVWIPSNNNTLNWYELSGDNSYQDFLDYLHLWDELFPEQK